MNDSLRDQLQQLELDKKSFGSLPSNEDITLATKHIKNPDDANNILEQWRKLCYIRKNLHVLEHYLESNKGESLNDWLINNKETVSNLVTDQIGGFNNDNKGVTAFFLNLQKVYDDAEEQYDGIENNKDIPKDFSKNYEAYADDRKEKRKARQEIRKVTFKDFKKNNQGFFVPDGAEVSADDYPTAKKDDKKEEEPAKEEVKKENITAENVSKSSTAESLSADATQPIVHEAKVIDKKDMPKDNMIGIYIAGAIIIVGIIGIFAINKKK